MLGNAATFAIFVTMMYRANSETTPNSVDVNDLCLVGISPESVSTARREFENYLNDNARMVYIYLRGDTEVQSILDTYIIDKNEKGSLTTWVWVSENSTYLLQLPVDTDAATFGLMRKNVYSMNIEVKVLGAQKNCSFNQMNISDSLFDTLFNNITVKGEDDGNKLCRQMLENQRWQQILFSYTAIWVWHDFQCFFKDTNDTISSSMVKKSSSTNCIYVIGVMIFYLHPFIYIFLCTESHNQDYSSTYGEDDIPYHPQRFIYRYLHDRRGSCPNKSMVESYSLIPMLRLIVTCGVICTPFMVCYSIFFKRYKMDLDINFDVYKHSELYLWLSLPLFFVHAIIQVFLLTKVSDKFVFFDLLHIRKKKTVFRNVQINNHLKFERNEKLSQKLVLRLNLLFYSCFWKKMLTEWFKFQSVGKLPVTILQCFLNTIFIVLNILSCFSPIIWIWFIMPLSEIGYLAKNSNAKERNKPRQQKQRNEEYGPFFFLILSVLYCFVFPLMATIDSFTIVFTPVSYTSRIIIYTLFIAIPSLDSQDFHYYLVIFTAISYAVRFVHSFLETYRCLLDLMFKMRKEEAKHIRATGKIPRISVEDFDKIAEKTFPLPLHIFILLLKIIFVSCFIGISTTVLKQSKQGDDAIKNVLTFCMILFSPGIFIALFFKEDEDVVKEQKPIVMLEMQKMNLLDTSLSIDDSDKDGFNFFKSLLGCYNAKNGNRNRENTDGSQCRSIDE